MDGLLDDLDGRLFLLYSCEVGLLFIWNVRQALLKDYQTIRLFMENFRQLSLLEMASLISDETTDEGVFVRVETHRNENYTCNVSDNGRFAIIIHEKLVAA